MSLRRFAAGAAGAACLALISPGATAHSTVTGWNGAAALGPLNATVGGRRARVFLDTGRPGISVSSAFLRRIHVKVPANFEPELSVVRLDDVAIAGRRQRSVLARMTYDDRHELYVGLDVFPQSAIAVSRTGAARVRSSGCRIGPKLLTSRGTAEVHGPDFFGQRITLIDTRHRGAPETRTFGALPPTSSRGRAVLRMLNPGSWTCEANARAIVFAGQLYGHDKFCSVVQYGFSPGLFSYRAGYDVLLGLDSLEAAAVVFDVLHARVCVS